MDKKAGRHHHRRDQADHDGVRGGSDEDDGAHRARAQGDDGAWLDGFDLEGGGPPRRYGAAELTTADNRAASSSYGRGSYEQEDYRASAAGATPHDGEEDGKPAAAEVGYRSTYQGGIAGEDMDTDEGPYSENKRLLGASHDTEVDSLIEFLRRTIETRRRRQLGVLDDGNQKEELRKLWSDLGESLGMSRREDDHLESITEPTTSASTRLSPTDAAALNLSRQEHIEPSPGAYRVTPGRSVERASAVDSHSEQTSDEPFQGNPSNVQPPPPPPLNQQTSDARTILIEANLVTEDREPLSMLVEATPINRKRQIAYILTAVLVVIALIIGVVVGLLRTRPSPSPIPPAFVPLSRNFSSVLPSFTIERLNDTSSPQYRAFQWAYRDRIPSIEAPTDEIIRLERMKERFALATLYYATEGERSWKRNQNWLSTTANECYWTGAVCSTIISEDAESITCRAPERLDALDLSNNFLKQALPEEIGLLTTLSSLNMGNNDLEALPAQLGSLTRLVRLDLSYNALRSIPTHLGLLTNLEDLSLGYNELASIPTEIGRLLNVTYINLMQAGVTGTIPSEIGQLQNLRVLQLSGTRVNGTIPSELGQASSLKTLNVFNNTNLQGPIPSELGNLLQLTELALSANSLTGIIPTELGRLTLVSEVWLDQNKLTGKIPGTLQGLESLTGLLLNGNLLVGGIPTELGSLSLLSYLWLNNNSLTGTIPSAVGQLESLTDLSLAGNLLNGTVPSELGNLSSLNSLKLSENQLTGPVPSELGSLPVLTELWLTDNLLTGSIPPSLQQLGKATDLSLNHNFLNGTVPTELGYLSELQYLWLQANGLTGTIPSELGQLTHLTEVYLRINSLSGTIPPELGRLSLLSILSLEQNLLTGTVPSNVCRIPNITVTIDCDRMMLCDCCPCYSNSSTRRT
jgi:Leucine-rich repeat (LRR) protein